MGCVAPIPAYRSRSVNQLTGKRPMVFDLRDALDDKRVFVPCGKCIGCSNKRSQDWGTRCTHEASMHVHNSFVTLTYSDKHLPLSNSLSPHALKLFLERCDHARQGHIRYFACGEYGHSNGRPHYHALLFGMGFPDKRDAGKTDSGDLLFVSKELDDLWPYGINMIGSVNARSACYVAKYMSKALFEAHFPSGGVEPPFQRMSRCPGLGRPFFDKFQGDHSRDDFALMDGRKVPLPRYYDQLLSADQDSSVIERLKHLRREKAFDIPAVERTFKRVRAREEFMLGTSKERKL